MLFYLKVNIYKDIERKQRVIDYQQELEEKQELLKKSRNKWK